MKTGGKHIVFDWNGTLLDDVDAMHECTNKVLEKLGCARVTLEYFRAEYYLPFNQFYKKLGYPEPEIADLMNDHNHIFHDHYEPMAMKMELRAGAREILKNNHINGLHNYILSNHIIEPIMVQLKRLGIDSLFDEVLAYADRATQFRDMTKGERLRRYRAKHGIDDHGTIIIGDTIEEIHIAREQNLISVAITGGCGSEEKLRAENPDYVIHSLTELQPILEERRFVS